MARIKQITQKDISVAVNKGGKGWKNSTVILCAKMVAIDDVLLAKINELVEHVNSLEDNVYK